MDANLPTLEDLCTEIRKSAPTDIEFAQRVALVCYNLIESKAHAVEAIRTVFRIQ